VSEGWKIDGARLGRDVGQGESKPATVVLGGDRTLMERAGLLHLVTDATEVPCAQCGTPTLIVEASVRTALASGAPVWCLWCTFADRPDLLAQIGPKPNPA
jgi:hypothetical protein